MIPRAISPLLREPARPRPVVLPGQLCRTHWTSAPGKVLSVEWREPANGAAHWRYRVELPEGSIVDCSHVEPVPALSGFGEMLRRNAVRELAEHAEAAE